jgi:hypothetical protein
MIVGVSAQSFPLGLYSLLLGGLLLTVSGCIGPGRYKKDYKILLYEPQDGSSFSQEVPVSGFVKDTEITSANIIINGRQVGKISFDQSTMGRTQIDRKKVIYEPVNKIILEANGVKSNERYFSFFDYSNEMSDEEIDQLIEMENKGPDKPLDEARKDYLERTSTNLGSISLGIATASLLTMAIGAIFDYIIQNFIF